MVTLLQRAVTSSQAPVWRATKLTAVARSHSVWQLHVHILCGSCTFTFCVALAHSQSVWQKATFCVAESMHILFSFVIVLQARRTKEILSANTEAPFIVEELLDGKDFRSGIKRQDFEDLAGNFFERAAEPLQHLLQRNGLSAGDVHAVELLGGGSRIPKLQAELGRVLNGRVLDK